MLAEKSEESTALYREKFRAIGAEASIRGKADECIQLLGSRLHSLDEVIAKLGLDEPLTVQ
jgi:hypothetical protein